MVKQQQRKKPALVACVREFEPYATIVNAEAKAEGLGLGAWYRRVGRVASQASALARLELQGKMARQSAWARPKVPKVPKPPKVLGPDPHWTEPPEHPTCAQGETEAERLDREEGRD